ncbi:MAG TPA: hypothetical protein VGT61_00615 [Thermomicrobiales bacterium]|jgi:hypothetical protein|nr:hypothetical protein [Thermomicrobiales bacterium]
MSANLRAPRSALTHALLVFALALAIVLPMGAATRAQETGDDPGNAVASDTVTVEGDLSAGDYAWESMAIDLDGAEAEVPSDRLGFLVAIDAVVDVSDGAGIVADLVPGEALGLEPGRELSVTGRDGAAARVAVVGLVPAGEAAGQEMVTFPLAEGRHRMVLQRYAPPAGEAVQITGLIQPILVLIQGGEAGYETIDEAGTPTGDSRSLRQGQAVTLLTDSQLTPTGPDPLVLLIVQVGQLDDAPARSVGPSVAPSAESSPSGSVPPRFGIQRLPIASASPSNLGGLIEPSRRPDLSDAPDGEGAVSPSPSAPPPFGT